MGGVARKKTQKERPALPITRKRSEGGYRGRGVGAFLSRTRLGALLWKTQESKNVSKCLVVFMREGKIEGEVEEKNHLRKMKEIKIW